MSYEIINRIQEHKGYTGLGLVGGALLVVAFKSYISDNFLAKNKCPNCQTGPGFITRGGRANCKECGGVGYIIGTKQYDNELRRRKKLDKQQKR